MGIHTRSGNHEETYLTFRSDRRGFGLLKRLVTSGAGAREPKRDSQSTQCLADAAGASVEMTGTSTKNGPNAPFKIMAKPFEIGATEYGDQKQVVLPLGMDTFINIRTR